MHTLGLNRFFPSVCTGFNCFTSCLVIVVLKAYLSRHIPSQQNFTVKSHSYLQKKIDGIHISLRLSSSISGIEPVFCCMEIVVWSAKDNISRQPLHLATTLNSTGCSNYREKTLSECCTIPQPQPTLMAGPRHYAAAEKCWGCLTYSCCVRRAHLALDTYHVGAFTQTDHPKILYRRGINMSGHLTYVRHLFLGKMKSSSFPALTIKANFHNILSTPAQMNPAWHLLQKIPCLNSGISCFWSPVSAAPACLKKPKSSLSSWLADPSIGTLWAKAALKKVPARSDVTALGALSFNLHML